MTGDSKVPVAERRFAALQARLRDLDHGDPLDAPGVTVVSVPSLDVDRSQLMRHRSVLSAYEERALYQLLLLQRPDVRIVFVSSEPLQEAALRGYLDLLPGLDRDAVRRRVVNVSPCDASPRPLAEKVLERADVLAAIRAAAGDPARAFVAPYSVTALERDLALALGLPLYGTAPAAASWGTKSGARRLFAQEGVPHPAGFEGLRDRGDVVDALRALRAARPAAARAVVKLDAGLHGEGNRVVRLAGIPPDGPAGRAAAERRVAALGEPFLAELAAGGGVVEELVGGTRLRSPSVQLRLRADGATCEASTHEQILGGENGQTFVGCRFPADPAYAPALVAQAEAIGRRLAREGALGRFAVDFVAVRDPAAGWRTYAIEINLREGGTTHAFGALRLLTGGRYDAAAGRFATAGGEQRCYRASDDLQEERWTGIRAEDLLDAARAARLLYDPASRAGIVFHLLRALPTDGHVGLTAIAATRRAADGIYARALRLLDALAAAPTLSARAA